MIRLNAVGVFLWKLLEQGASEEELIRAVLEHYDVTRNVVEADVAAVLKTLKTERLLED